jgi:hypothetical protein
VHLGAVRPVEGDLAESAPGGCAAGDTHPLHTRLTLTQQGIG